MSIRKRAAIGVATAGVAALAISGLAAPGSAGAAKAAKIPVVVVHMSSKHINLSTGSVHAGTVEFKVVTHKGDHLLQVANLHKGYSLQQAGSDLQKAFGGDTKAISRVDHRITFRGGAETKPSHPGAMSVTLPAGQYVLIDQNGSAVNFLKVHGTAPSNQAAMPFQGRHHGLHLRFRTRTCRDSREGLDAHLQPQRPAALRRDAAGQDEHHAQAGTQVHQVRCAGQPVVGAAG